MASRSSSEPHADDSNRSIDEWLFFRTSRKSRSPFEKEFDNLHRDARAALTVLMRRYRSDQLRPKDLKHLTDGIYELRWRQGSNHFRLLFCRWGRHAVALTAFYKNQQQTPQADLKRAKDRCRAWYETFGDEPTDDG